MRKVAGLVALLMLIAVPLFAQDSQSSPPSQDSQESQSAPQPDNTTPETPKPHIPPYIPKYEISAEGNFYSFYAPTGKTLGMLGWNGSFEYTYKTWLGLVGEGFGDYYHQGTDGNTAIYAGLAGVQFYPFGRRKVTLFLRGLAGAGRYRIEFPAFAGFGFSAVDKTTEIYEAGGGIDYNLHNHWSIRVVEADFDKASFFTGNQNRASYRILIGAVYRFGKR